MRKAHVTLLLREVLAVGRDEAAHVVRAAQRPRERAYISISVASAVLKPMRPGRAPTTPGGLGVGAGDRGARPRPTECRLGADRRAQHAALVAARVLPRHPAGVRQQARRAV